MEKQSKCFRRWKKKRQLLQHVLDLDVPKVPESYRRKQAQNFRAMFSSVNLGLSEAQTWRMGTEGLEELEELGGLDWKFCGNDPKSPRQEA